jgi:hypothetical protein
MKLSPRAITLLTLINDRTAWEGDERPGKVLTLFFYPQSEPMWSPTLNACIDVSSGGDASAFRGLERKGLIVRTMPKETTGTARYAYAITEEGIQALAVQDL